MLREEVMPKTATYVLNWNPELSDYVLYERASEHTLLLHGEGDAWLVWLTGNSSFAFQGKVGQLTLLKEARGRGGEGYWYAYRRQGKRMHKKYVGRSADLTPIRLEAIAQTFAVATGETSPVPDSLVQDQDVVDSSHFHDAASTQCIERELHVDSAHPGKDPSFQWEQLLMPKLRLPRLYASLVNRERLYAVLDAVQERKLMLFSAPAGFGKTTLALQWVASHSVHSQFPPVAWLSLDANDNDPARFWRYVITACRPFQADAGQFALYLLATTLQPHFKAISLQEVLTTFLNAVSRSGQEGILILEDYHLISEPRIHELMAFLLEHLPTSLHLVILSRNDPALPLVRLRASGDLCELHAADLRFSSEEMAAFLQQNVSYEADVFPCDVLQQLDARLEGWVVGLRLFTLALNGRVNQQGIEQALITFVGSHRTLQDYFVTEVLSTQPEPVQHFLLSTCVLGCLTASLCDAVTGGDNGQHLLAILEREGLFLEALDEVGQWYRYHALFAEAMRDEARRRFGEDMLHALSVKASQWYELHGLLTEAIEAALQAQDMTRSAELIEHFLNTLWDVANTALPAHRVYEFHTMCRWLEQLPETLMRQRPLLCFAYASSMLFAFIVDRPSVAPQLPARFEKALQMAEDGWRNADDVLGLSSVLAFRAVLARQQGEIVQAITSARQALVWLPTCEFMWRAICLGVVGNDELLKGQLHLARKTALETRTTSVVSKNPAFIRASSVMLSIVCFEQGELHLAAEYYRQMLEEAREAEDQDDIGQASLGLALLSYEWNDLHTAEQLAQEALACGQLLANHEFQVQSTLLLARIEHARGQTRSAQQRCHALQVRLSAHTAPLLFWYSRQVQALQARLALAVGDHATVQRWMEHRSQNDEDLPLIYREMETLIEVRWLIMQEKETEALALLIPWLDDARQNGRVRAALEMQVLMALAYAGKQIHEARFLLQSVLAQAAAERCLRLFLDEGMPMATLLRTMIPYLREPSLLAYLQTILQAFPLEQEGLQQESNNAIAPLVEPLSPQEQRVLRLLAAGRSNREIADELIVSVNTVRSHVQSIYRKLSVNNRVAASKMARLLHLL